MTLDVAADKPIPEGFVTDEHIEVFRRLHTQWRSYQGKAEEFAQDAQRMRDISCPAEAALYADAAGVYADIAERLYLAVARMALDWFGVSLDDAERKLLGSGCNTSQDPNDPLQGSMSPEPEVLDAHRSKPPTAMDLLASATRRQKLKRVEHEKDHLVGHLKGNASCTVGECFFMRERHKLATPCRVLRCQGVLHAVATDWSDYSYEQGLGPVRFLTECDRCGDVRHDEGFKERIVSFSERTPIGRVDSGAPWCSVDVHYRRRW